MTKDVLLSGGQEWGTNNNSWYTILEHGKVRLEPALLDRFEWHLDAIGLDFTDVGAMTDAEAIAMATWLLETLDVVQSSEDRWESEQSIRHLAVLATGLRNEISRRSAPSTPGPGS